MLIENILIVPRDERTYKTTSHMAVDKTLYGYSQLPLYSGPWELELASSLAIVHDSGSLLQSNDCNLFLPGT